MRSTQKDRWTVRYVDTMLWRHDKQASVLHTETRPSPREPHPGTVLHFAATRQRGTIVRCVALRNEMNLQVSVQTVWCQVLDGSDATQPAARMLSEMTLEEMWALVVGLSCNSTVFAMEAIASILDRRKTHSGIDFAERLTVQLAARYNARTKRTQEPGK